jgi:dUTP pyrophosphatase
MELRFKKLDPKATTPHYASGGAACFDLTATEVREEGITITYKTGLAFQIPEGYVGLLYPRSSVSKTHQVMANSVGVIDSDYRGEIMFKFQKLGGHGYNVGDRVGQMMIIPVPSIELEEVESLEETQRGSGAFGSTGA